MVELPPTLLAEVDQLVQMGMFPTRDAAVAELLRLGLEALRDRTRRGPAPIPPRPPVPPGVHDPEDDRAMGAEARLTELNLTLPTAPRPVATYLSAVRQGNLLYVSGHGPLRPDGTLHLGKVGAGLDPCGAVQVAFDLPDAHERETSFRLGVGRNPAEVQNLIQRFRRADASRLGQGVDTPGRSGAPQGFENLRGAYGIAQT